MRRSHPLRHPRLNVQALEDRVVPTVSVVLDINTVTDTVGSTPLDFVQVGALTYFSALDPNHGRELWRTDGSSTGTTIVKDIRPGGYDSNPSHLVSVGGLLYFTANDGVSGLELWRSNGTSSGTVLVADLRVGAGDSNPAHLTNFSGNLYFTANDGVSGFEPWRTTGGIPGLLANLEPGLGNSDPTELTPVGANLYFRATTAVEGTELWSTTNAGIPELVEDINPGASSSIPQQLTNVSGVLYFTAFALATGRELWRSTSPTPAGTLIVEDLNPGVIATPISQLTNGGGVLYFTAADNSGAGFQIFRSQGTLATTFAIADINPGPDLTIPHNFTMVGPTLYFSADNGSDILLWKSDGTSAGTVLVENNAPGPNNLTNVGGVLYFSANDPAGGDGRELWKSEGTDANTFIVEDINPGLSSSDPGDLANIGGVLYFSADNGSTSRELWRSTAPSSTATDLVRDINTANESGLPDGFDPGFVNAGGFFLFAADNGGLGRELWRSGGTGLTTGQVADIAAGGLDSNPENLYFHNGFVYFSAIGANGAELWRSDGTGPGTTIVRDINPGIGDSNPLDFITFNGLLYFSAFTAAGGRELWRTDGTFNGTTIVRDINPGAVDSAPAELINLNGTLFFSASSSTHDRELWRSDGTSSGTTMVRDINPLAASGTPAGLIVFNDTLFFHANDGTNGLELWRSNGTFTGTTLVRDINPGSSGSAAFPRLILGDRFYFAASDGVHGAELWSSDGTSSGTALVADIRPGSAGSGIGQLATDGIRLAFAADDGTHGSEFWIHEPSAGATVLAADLRTGSGDSSPSNFANVNGTLYFTANDGINGRELWRASDGVALLAEQVVPGSGDGSPNRLFDYAGVVYFVATSPTAGRELHRIDGGLPPRITSNGADQSAALDQFENKTALTTVTSFDPNGGPLTYSLSGVDAADFTISAATGALAFAATPNFEAPQDANGDNIYSVTVRVSDGLLFDEQFLTVTVLDRAHDQAIVYVDVANAGKADGTILADADPFTGGNQAATVGVNAFAALEAGIDTVAVDGTLAILPAATAYSAPATLAVPFALRVPGGNVTVSGVLSGTAGLRKTGPGTLTLGGVNTFTGRTFIDRSYVFIVSDAPLGDPANDVIVSSLGALVYTASATTSRTFELSGTLGVSAGAVLTLSNATIGGGFLDGPGTLRASLDGVTLFSGVTTSASLTIDLLGGATLEQFTNNGHLATSSTKSNSFINFNNNAAGHLTVRGNNFGGYNFSSLGQMIVNGIMSNSGTTPVVFGGGSLTTINSGGSINTGIAGALVTNGYVQNKGSFGNAAGAITIDFGGKVEGNAVFGSLVTKNGGVFSPGSSPGPATTHRLAINGGGRFEFEIANASGTPAALSGWDTITVAPTVYGASPEIAYTATPASKYTIELASRADSGDFNSAGNISNFNSALGYAWKFADGVAASPSGIFDANAFAIDTSGFSNPFNGGFGIELRDGGKNLYVVYTPVAGPMVTSFVVNDGDAQRSRITTILVNFASPVDAAALQAVGAVTLTRTSGGPGTVVNTSSGLIVAPGSGMVSSITLTFANLTNSGVENTSLADGRWQLAIPSAAYTSPLNAIHRLFGDADSNGTVDGSDLAPFGNAFGATVTSSPFDFDNNGTIDGLDLAQFGNRFGVTL